MGHSRRYILSSEYAWAAKMDDLRRYGEIEGVLDTYITTLLPGASRIPLEVPKKGS
jgi:hypothetical protein